MERGAAQSAYGGAVLCGEAQGRAIFLLKTSHMQKSGTREGTGLFFFLVFFATMFSVD